MRPFGVTGALIVITAGAILTYAVSFTISGISIHAVGVVITLTGTIALAIRLARSLSGLRKRDESRRSPLPQRPDAEADYPQHFRHAAPPTTVTQVPSSALAESAQRRPLSRTAP